jgi:hypothetical protein
MKNTSHQNGTFYPETSPEVIAPICTTSPPNLGDVCFTDVVSDHTDVHLNTSQVGVASVGKAIDLLGNTPYVGKANEAKAWFSYADDLDAQLTIKEIDKHINVRCANVAGVEPAEMMPFQFVIKQSLERYFALIEGALDDIKFSGEEIRILLSLTPGPVWSTRSRPIDCLLDDQGVDDLADLEQDSPLGSLGHKLLELTPVQETALVDLCESYWRNPRGGDSFQRLCEVKDMPEVNH